MLVQVITAEVAKYSYGGESWAQEDISKYPRGKIVEYTNLDEFCHSWVISPGVSLLPRGLLVVFYMLWLFYLFLGIQIISDTFMDAIEVITSQTKVVEVRDPEYEDMLVPKRVAVWNPTFANLTLMAFGSSAPEIILNVFETASTLGSTPGELGPSTIVGSASFNFLIISAVSILAVSEAYDNRTVEDLEADGTPRGVKKIDDLGVFGITASWSVIAYLWLFYVLSDYEVAAWEAYLTFAFFWILLAMAVAADIVRREAIKAKQYDRIGIEDSANLTATAVNDKPDARATLEPADDSVMIPVTPAAEKAITDQSVESKPLRAKTHRPGDSCIHKGYSPVDFVNVLAPVEAEGE
jgi:Ca2+/Na+ antiporter